ncbi:hypothetical protein SEUCBS140593_005226 [Sporothrix eucalyptigena]|uniref:Up-regulated during septation protein 1 domain-containing protein n=1 Tax=Sporothrix eucalyptigena TaxID=1812306 RepID=A0ABP0BV98_9PEZI
MSLLLEQQQQKQAPLPPPPADEKDKQPFLWRMHSQAERKYQLFPKDKQQQPAAGKSLDPEQAFALAMGANGASGANASNNATAAGNPLRLRIKEHTLIRRRKVSVPELGPMTTVQEVAMDSPTIPGRPPLHERSISAPGNSWKQHQQQHHHLVDCMLPQSQLSSFYDDIPEQSVYVPYDQLVSSPIDLPRCNSAQAVLSPSASKAPELTETTITSNTPHISLRLPLSPKNLAPLVIPPPQGTHGRYHQTSASLSGTLSSTLRAPPSSSSSRFRSGSTPVETALRSARSDESPRTRTPFTPFTPLSAVSNASTLPTPISATSTTSVPASVTSSASTIQPPAEASRVSPKPWTEGNYTVSTPKDGKDAEHVKPANAGNVTPAPVETAEPRSAPPQSSAATLANSAASASAAASAAASAILKSIPSAAAILGHRRGQSESGSIMERGRPRKRSASREGSTSAAINAMVAAGISVSQAQAQPVQAAPTAQPAASSTTVATSTTTATTATTTAASSSASTTVTTGLKRSASKASKSAERRAFEMLPRGYKAAEAPAVLGANETAALATQALQQAARFEVLRKEDVDNLSRELRNLDERTEYLRRTYTSLRAGRRNLHGRICQYLRSPRVAKFSHDSMLRQEEALAELDTSIDDWVTKLEQAENRRTRVRQKLLEHVAAAATLPLTSSLAAAAVAAAGLVPSTASPTSSGVVGSSESLQLAMGIKPPSPPYASSSATQQSISTPPRSPTKTAFQPAAAVTAAAIISPVAASSPSPQRPIVAQVPSTILEQPLVEEAMAAFSKSMAAEAQTQAAPSTPTTQTAPSKPNKAVVASPISPASTLASGRRVDVESIRVYAGDDVYALLADVEDQITQMGGPVPAGGNGTPATAPVAVGSTAAAQDYFSLPRNESLSDEERRRLHRAHSQELLNGGTGSKRSTPTPPASPTPPPPAETTATTTADPISRPESPADSVEIFLTSAVFRPERSILAI